MELDEFRIMLQQVRAGDASAAARLVQEYEPAIRRYVRVSLTDPRLRQVLDTMDVCQSILANFFVRVALGQFDLEKPQQLFKLLASMARNRVLNHARDQQAERRDQRRIQADGGEAVQGVADPGASPSRIVAGRELLAEVRRRLTPEELGLLDARAEGREWTDIAERVGGTAEGLRKKLGRALDRVGRELKLEEVGEI